MTDATDRILDIAGERFNRYGFKKTTMDEICRDAKISKKTIYDYFKDKEELFVNLFIRETLRARQVIFERLGDVPDVRQRLVRLAQIGIDYFSKDTFITRVLKDDGNLYTPFFSSKYHTIVEEGIISIIADMIREGIRQGVFHKTDEKVTGYMLFRLFQAFSYAKTGAVADNEKDHRHGIQVMTDFVLRALCK